MNDNPGKISIKFYNTEVVCNTDNSDLTIDEVINLLYGMLVTHGFQTSTIIKGFKEFIEEHEEEI